MSSMKRLFDRVFDGSDEMFAWAERSIAEVSAKYDDSTPIAYPNTAYYLGILYAMTGKKNATLGELKESLAWARSQMTKEQRLDDVFRSGIGTACAAEVIEAVKYIGNPQPYEEPYLGHVSDAEVRELGVPLVTGDIPGFVVLIGAAPSDEQAAEIIKSYQNKSIFVFLVGECCLQAQRAGIGMGFPVRVYPVGPELPSVAHVVSVAVRAALIFGGITPGDYEGIKKYTFDRVNAAVNAFTPVPDITVACGGGAIAYGFPVITNDADDMWPVPRSLIIQPDVGQFVETSIEARGMKVKITNIDMPTEIGYATAFEGEVIRRKEMRIEADGSRHDCLELCKTRELGEVEDHKITVVGKDIQDYEVGGQLDLAYVVEVAGKKMQSDFEPVFERQFHAWINGIEGVMHTGQRDLIRLRISIDTFDKGFRLNHIGEVLYAKIKSEFDAVVDKCQVTIYTEPETVKQLRKEANEIYDKRDARLLSLTDEGVKDFYACVMCQSFSPSHVCIVTPERLGLCGAVSWLDAKATYELDPSGTSKIVPKGDPIDEVIGIWDTVDEAVGQYSMGALEHVTLYSIMQDPMTSCGCFECICGIEPTSGGVVIVNREHIPMTPLGMTFSEMAAMTGGGVQTPGYMGHGKHFIASKKFMSADGGSARIVWMPKALKDQVAEKLNRTAKELYGIENYADMIADETVTEDDLDKLLEFLQEKGHPVLGLEPMF
ncbi:MAG: CO dehydrogenase/CO-methylating acetyl-CoA synthase complex subunit beta [Oscillospiraceae bacterium]|jgi:acetyl-CoA synthase|nr:CO dehydrogenase/CO-methylating acetyl-CoA synthase complex subunit beta [Oscillospiraceae bacterium]